MLQGEKWYGEKLKPGKRQYKSEKLDMSQIPIKGRVDTKVIGPSHSDLLCRHLKGLEKSVCLVWKELRPKLLSGNRKQKGRYRN